MITQALYRYLTDPRNLTGHAAVRFSADQVVAGVAYRDRNQVREQIRARVGKSFFAGRRPQNGRSPTAVTLRLISSTIDESLAGVCPWRVSVVQVDVWTRGGDAAIRGSVLATLLELATVGYHGDSWDETWIGDVTLERPAEPVPVAPVDGSDLWTFVNSFDLRIHHAAVGAEYPITPLEPVLEFLTPRGVGEWFSVSAESSRIPENRSITNVQIIITDAWPDFGLLKFQSGAPWEVRDTVASRGPCIRPDFYRYPEFSGVLVGQLALTLDTGEVAITMEVQE